MRTVNRSLAMRNEAPPAGRRRLLAVSAAGVLAALAPPLPGGRTALAKSAGRARIVFYSHTGVTRTAVGHLQSVLQCGVTEIHAAKPYPDDFNATSDRASHEQLYDARPAIEIDDTGLADAQVILVGYPIWFTKMPMLMSTFFERYDLAGKTILPFCTFEETGLGDTGDDIKALCPKAMVHDGLALPGGDSANFDTLEVRDDIATWLRGAGLVT